MAKVLLGKPETLTSGAALTLRLASFLDLILYELGVE
jgi:hypothetical protein